MATNVKPEAMLNLAKLIANNYFLTSIILSGSYIRSERVKAIAEAIKSHFSLIFIDLSENEIETVGAIILAIARALL